jgi:hypothetical protein
LPHDAKKKQSVKAKISVIVFIVSLFEFPGLMALKCQMLFSAR